MRRRLSVLVLAALLPLVEPISVQAQRVVIPASDRGWIGFGYATVTVHVQNGTEESGSTRSVVVTRVYEGSPAAEAGLQTGDTLLTVNGTPVDPNVFERLALRPGDPVTMTLRRGGREQRLRLTAAERPTVTLFEVSPEQRIRIDSLQNDIIRFMEDSARVTLRQLPLRVRVGQGAVAGWTVEGDSLSVLLRSEAPEGFSTPWILSGDETVSFPFTAFVARSAKTDSILAQIQELQEALEVTRRAELQRQRELADALAREQERIDQTDEDLRRTRQRQNELRAQLEAARQRLAQESRRELMARTELLDSISGTPLLRRPENQVGVGAVRIPTPHMVGRTVVAGAQLLPLNPGLGEYFGTDEGVLVTEVIPGSPAESAGIESGDVLVAVDGDPVRSVSDVRDRLADVQAWPVDVTLVRKGQRMSVRLAR